jgi:outer membrane protein assembly factor BamB
VPAGASPDAAPSAARTAAPTAARTAAPTSSLAVAFQGNALHDGYSVRGVAAPPLRKEWSRKFTGGVSYPIVAEGRVFVTVADPRARYGTTLHALDQRTGRNAWRPVKLGGTYWWSALTYGDGRVFALNHDGLLRAFAARTGKLLWSRQLRGYSYDSAPTYAGGRVYTTGGGVGVTVSAVDGRTGRVVWERTNDGGGSSSPAVTAGGVHVTFTCRLTYAFGVRSGNRLWTHDTGCVGGGGRTPAVAAGGLWARDSWTGRAHSVLDLKTGRPLRSFGQGQDTLAPAFSGGLVHLVDGGTLSARPTGTPNRKRWTFADRTIGLPPLAVDDIVYALSTTGRLWAIRAATGKAVWSTSTGVRSAIAEEDTVSHPLKGLAAGQGHLLVPIGSVLISYGK